MTRRWLKLLAALLAMVLVAASCGDDGDGAAGDDTTGTTDAGSTETTAPAGDAEPDREAFLRLVSSIAPQQFDPLTGSFPCDVASLQLVYDSLVREEPDGTFAPGLAASWSTPDDTTFEITLQEGVTFQDGSPFDAEAVAAHFDRALTSPLSSVREQLAFIENVEVVDDLTVRLELSEPRVGVLPALLTGRAGMVASPSAVEEAGEQYGSDGAVGAGPYRYAQHTPGESYRVEAWDGYWNPDLQLLGGVEHSGISEQFQIDRIESGDLDYAALNDNLLPDVEAAAEEGTLDYVLDPTTQFMQVFVNFGVEPFDDVRVRRALNHAIDREAVNQALTEGAGTVAWGPLPPNSWGHNPEVADMYPYDPERAQELLAEAGHEDGLSFTAGVIEIPLYQRAAEVLQDMLADSDIDVTLEPVTGAEINDRLYVSKDLSAAFTAFNTPSDPGLALEAKYSSGGANNPAGTTVEGLDELLAEGAATTDRDERAEIYREAELIVMEHALEVPVYHFAGLVASAPEVRNVVKGYTACQGGNYLSPPVFVAE